MANTDGKLPTAERIVKSKYDYSTIHVSYHNSRPFVLALA